MRSTALFKHNLSFTKIVVLEFYDGIVSGFCEVILGKRAQWNRLELVSWDKGQDQRIFGLASISSASFTRVVELAATGGSSPRWPFWAPQTSSEKVKQEIAQIRETSKLFNRLVLTDGYLNEVLFTITVDAYLRRKLPVSLPCRECSSFNFWKRLLQEA